MLPFPITVDHHLPLDNLHQLITLLKFVFTQLCPGNNIGKYPPVTQSEAATENTQRKASFCLKTSMATPNGLKHVAMSGTT